MRVACVSALAMHGVWTMPDARVTCTGRGSAREGVRTAQAGRCGRRSSSTRRSRVGQAIRCLEADAAVVALDSAMNRRLISPLEVEAICMRSSRGRLLFGRARLRERVRNRDTRSPAIAPPKHRPAYPSAGRRDRRVDLIVGDRLVLELDGQAWHDRPGDFENDRSRDRALVAAGYLVLRASYRQVMTEWSMIEEQVLRIVRRRDHRWRRGSRR